MDSYIKMSDRPEESDTEKTTRIGCVTLAVVYSVVMGALMVGGGIVSLLEKRKGRGR